MAKDGTNRGGARVGAGAKKKPLTEKIAEGNPGGRKLTVMEFKETADLNLFWIAVKCTAVVMAEFLLTFMLSTPTAIRA